MYTAERQRAQPYLEKISGPLYEQWYLLHHRMVRVVTNHPALPDQVRDFLYYAELLAEYTYDSSAKLPVDIPIDLLWQVGERLHRPVALTCYLFETRPGEQFPPAPAESAAEDADWEEVSGLNEVWQTRWNKEALRFREFEAYPGVTCRINTVLDKENLYGVIFIENVANCTPWFLMRFVFYMLLGAMFGYDGYKTIHAGAVALDDAGILLVGAPASGKTTLVLSCLQAGMSLLADDVLFLAIDDDLVRVYAFPEDIGVRKGTYDLLGQYEFMRTLTYNERQKHIVDVRQYFYGQIVGSCPLRLMLFLHSERRSADFRAELLSPAQAVSRLVQEYIDYQRARAKSDNAEHMFAIFTDMAIQAPSYCLWLSPHAERNASEVRALLEKHGKKES